MFKLNVTFFIYTCIVLTISAQKIQDPKFAQAIRWSCPNCIDTANNLTQTATSLNSITLLNEINDLTGIDGFTNLSSLNCADNKLTFLPTLPVNLRTLYCGNNKLTELSNLPKNLTLLNCAGNLLKNLPPLPGNLITFDCSKNQLTTIPRLPTSLINFYCSYNEITVLPSLPSLLSSFGCAFNKLKTLPDLPKNLVLLSIFGNPDLKCLPQLPDSLSFLEISSSITCLPNAVPKAQIFLYNGQNFRTATLPSCSIAVTSPCYVSALNNGDFDKNVHIYPSPTEGVVFIESRENLTDIQVYNNLGQMILQTKKLQLDITTQAAGIYLIKIKSKDLTVIKKIIKQ